MAINYKIHPLSAANLLELLLSLAIIQTIACADKPIRFSVILSFGEYGYNSSGAVPSLDLALERVAAMQVLPGYRLHYDTVWDSKCSRGASLDAFFRDFQSEPTKIALVGCGCSVATEPVAEISHRWNISQLSIASAVSSLGDRTRFKSIFRTYPTFKNFAPAVLSILNHYGWKRAAFLSENLNLFNKLYTDVQELVQNLRTNNTELCCFSNTDVTLSYPLFKDPLDAIEVLEDVFRWNGEYRVFLMNSYPDVARDVMCQASKRGLTYPNYAWIVYGWYPEDWWMSDNPNGCTNAEMEEFVEKARPIIVQQYPTADHLNESTDSGITPAEHEAMYLDRVKNTTYDVNAPLAGISYDTIWALAKALNKTQGMVDSRDISGSGCEETLGELVDLNMFNYSNGLMGCIIRWSLTQTNFTGVVGDVHFDETGSIIQNRVRLLQYRRVDGQLKQVRFGFVDRDKEFRLAYEEGENDKTVFPSGIPPDGTPEQVIHTFNAGLTGTYYFLASLGIIFGIGCLIFNFAFRERKVILMTSPKLNYFIIAGALLMLGSIYIGVLPTTEEPVAHVQCILPAWLYVTGYLLVFGTILAKMWRVYHIFHNPAPNKTTLQDYHLILLTLLITGTGLSLVLASSAAQHEKPYLVQDKEDREGTTDLGVQEEYYIYECYDTSSAAFYVTILIFVYLVLLQVVGIVLAFQTRKVKIPILNDSKFVAALIYTSSVVLVALSMGSFPLRGHINGRAAVFYGGILIMAATFLGLTFIPKMINLYRDPQGERIFDKSNPTAKQPSDAPLSTYTKAESKNGEDVAPLLRRKIQEQEEVIEAKDMKIRELQEIINTM